MELIKLTEKTYYIKNPTNIGIYKIDDKNIFLIDSGNDKESAKKILKIVSEQGWNIKGIINTHSNADHIGGNKYIQDKTNCKIFAYNIEKSFTQYPILEPSFLYGGYPFKDLRHKFLLAKESDVTTIDKNLPEGLDYFLLRGHFFDMIGIKTSDNVFFLADSLFSAETITKYHLFYIYDVKEYLNTLNYLQTLEGSLFIPSHCEATKDISSLIKLNKDKVFEITEKIFNFCQKEISFENIMKKVLDDYNLTLNSTQYVLIGSTIRSYLSFLFDNDKITYLFKDNKMLWLQKH